jgi:hypothetical protein
LFAALLLLVPAAFAAKGSGGGGHKPGGGSGGGSATISLRMVTDVNSNGTPNYGDTVTFNVSTTATTEPHVRLQCFQNGTLVNTRDAGMYASYPWAWEQNMALSSSLWTGGAANCTAQVYYFSGSNTVWSTSLSFTAAA